MRKVLAAVICCVSTLVFVASAAADPGDLDLSFGDGGVVRTDVGAFDNASDLAIQPDGRVVAAGTVDQSGTRNVLVARYLPDGSLDAGFGSGGVVVPNRFHQVAPRLALQADGKIVLATRGESGGGGVFVYRFNPDGTPDTSFGPGADGTAALPPPSGVGVQSVAGVGIVSGGRIVVALRTSVSSGKEIVAFARLNSDGMADGSFGPGGFVSSERSTSWTPLSFAVQQDGRMLVAGFASPAPGRFFLDAFVARFSASGALDTTFDGDGVALVQRPSNGSEFQALAVGPNGSILAGGREFGSIFNQSQWLLARFTSDGGLDSEFGSGGLTLFDPGSGDDVILDLGVTPGGIYATGVGNGVSLGLPLALFKNDGTLDTTFGTGGVAGLPGQLTGGAWRLSVQADGKLLVLGSVQTFTPTFDQDLFLARYEGGPTDTTAPELNLPPVVAADATSPTGASVDYSPLVSAVDDVDGPVPVVCNPAAGNEFPFGDTVVSCTATDSAGNSASGSFPVYVYGAADQVDNLVDAVDGVGPGTSLADKVNDAGAALAQNKVARTCSILNDFISQVRALSGRIISAPTASLLITKATRIRAVLAC